MNILSAIKNMFHTRQGVVPCVDMMETLGANIAFDSETIWSDLRNGMKRVIRWDDLLSIKIVTTDKGPQRDDVFWVLQTGNNCLCFPIGVQGEQNFLEKVQQLNGFDNMALINSMSSVHNKEFKCWSKQ